VYRHDLSSKKKDDGFKDDRLPADSIQPMDPKLLRSKLQRLAWIRVGLGALAGLISGVLGLITIPDPSQNYLNFNPNAYVGIYLAIFVYILSYYLAKYGMGIVLPEKSKNKLITQGIGGYFMMFLFFWILYNTLCFSASCVAIF
jgi:hypothetical protein